MIPVKSFGWLLCLTITLCLASRAAWALDKTRAQTNSDRGPIGTPIGQPIDLEGNPNLEGIAFDWQGERLYVLNDVENNDDGKAKAGDEIQVYGYNPTGPELKLVQSFRVPVDPIAGKHLTSGRGLAFAEQSGRRVLYTLESQSNGSKDADGKANFTSRLWRIDCTDPDKARVQTVDLNQDTFDLRGAQVFDVACDRRGRIFITFDDSKRPASLTEQRARGILRFQAQGEPNKKILPANGKTPDHHNLGITVIEVDGHEYLVCSIEELTNNLDQEIYAAEPEAGRGLFKFPAPPLISNLNTERRLAYGAGVLWVAQQREGPDRVQRVNIKDNPFAPIVGYKRPRRIRVTMTSTAVCPEGQNRGAIDHNFGHPLSTDILPSQGGFFDEDAFQMKVTVPKGAPAQSGEKRLLTHMPLKDPSSLSRLTSAHYPAGTKNHGTYKTVYEAAFWTREYRHCVYPHLTSNSLGILKDTDFRLGHMKKGDPAIPDSLPRFHWTHQERIFEDFIARVKAYTREKHGVDANLNDTYWAARNVSEYIRDNYNYPAPPASEGGSGDSRGNFVDYDNFHVANGPAVYKMIMTDPRFKIELHNRRSGCMAAGGVFLAVMRYMGYPARWIGTSLQEETSPDKPHANGIFYDLNEDGMFNGDDTMDMVHGHYTNEVYLGPDYGWQRFDATPKKPDDRDGDGLDYDDFGYIHSRDRQYELMKRKITSGHDPKAVASSLGVGYNEYLFNHSRPRTPDCATTSVFHKATGVYTSACKGGQCYDFLMDIELPGRVRGRHAYCWLPCLTFDVTVNDGRPVIGENTVTFKPRGPWAQFEPGARVGIVLRKVERGTIKSRVLKTDIPWNKGSESVWIPRATRGKSIHLQVRKIGPEEFIGGASPEFSLP
ncbi:MAG: transglutaminase domain-containing protein [Pirellulales bacterium]|nr:transglutaminase domain-containing protein [Pirellulales bacterium]